MSPNNSIAAQHEAELYARFQWVMQAQQVALLQRLEQCKSEKDRDELHKLIRDAKNVVRVKYGDPRDHARSGTFEALRERIGAHESVGMWADLDFIQSKHAGRMARTRKSTEGTPSSPSNRTAPRRQSPGGHKE